MGEHKKIFVPIGDFHPDPPHIGLGLLRGCLNFVPMGGGQLAVPRPDTMLAPLDDASTWTSSDEVIPAYVINKMHTHYTNEIDPGPPIALGFDAVDLFVGGEGDLGLFTGITSHTPSFSNVSNSGIVGAYGAGDLASARWSMASWSWDSVVATNHSDPPQVYYYGGSGYFTDMITRGATTLRAGHVAILGKHVVFGNIIFEQDPLPTPNGTNADCLTFFGDATDLYHPDIVWWSGTDDETTFGDETSHPGENTGWQPLQDTPGSITGLCRAGDRALLVFKENSIYLMELTGSDELFHFSLLSSSIGTRHTESIVSVGRDVYFIDTSGRPMVVRNLSSVEQLGAGVVGEFFGTTYWGIQKMKEFDERGYVVIPFVPSPYGAYSSVWDTIFWSYITYKRAVPPLASGTKFYHRCLCYRVSDNKWFDYLVAEKDEEADGFGVSAQIKSAMPMASFVYDALSVGSEYELKASYPGVLAYDAAAVWFNGYTEFEPRFLLLGARTDGVAGDEVSTIRTKLFSLNQGTVASGEKAFVHAIRPVHDNGNDGTFTFTIGSSSAGDAETRRATKTVGATVGRDGWYSVDGGGISGEFFWVEMTFTSSIPVDDEIKPSGPHILGFEIEYSLTSRGV